MRRVALALAVASAWAAGAHLGGVARADGDWTVRRDPFDRSVIGRYKAILARSPHDRLALSALVSLYKHYRSIELLVHEYEAALDEHETAATLVVLADLVRSRGDDKRARALYTRAVVLAPGDPRSWLALGTLERQAGDHKSARTAFEQAVASAASADDKRPALRELIVETMRDGDVIATEVAFDDLLALSPRDGKLWMDRGDALAELHALDLARTAYQHAEKLLGSDPERKLLAIAAQGRLLERAGKPDEAIAEYDRAIGASPQGFYLRRELALRIVEIDKRRFLLPDVIAGLEKRWPAAARDAFEWKTLAELYKTARRPDDELHALEGAVHAEPRDTDAQWSLVRAYEHCCPDGHALVALREAVAANPTDLALGIELASRIWNLPNADDRIPMRMSMLEARRVALRNSPARAILQRLSRAHPRDADAHAQLADLYTRMNEPENALAEQRIVTKLEPTDDNIVSLGDALLQAGEPAQALETWQRLLAHKDATSRARYASVLAEHEFWDQAIEAYTKAMFSDDKNPSLWSGRALAYAEQQDWDSAIADAEHAVELLGPVRFEQGSEVRGALVRVLDAAARSDETSDQPSGEPAGGDIEWKPSTATEPTAGGQARQHIVAWSNAFHGRLRELGAGYMLAAYFSRHPGPELANVLVVLHVLVPADDGVLRELIRAHRLEHHFDEAIRRAQELAAKTPGRAAEMKELVASIDVDRKRYLEANAGDAEEPPVKTRGDTEEPSGTVIDRWAHSGSRTRVPLVSAARFGVGVGLAGTTERTMTIGSWDAVPLTRTIDAIVRADWTEHVGAMRSVNAVAGALGLGRHSMVTDDTAIMVSSTLRTELRFGGTTARGPWDRWGFAADVALEATTRALPATFGIRYEQAIADPARTSMLLFELSAGFRCLDFSGGSGACR